MRQQLLPYAPWIAQRDDTPAHERPLESASPPVDTYCVPLLTVRAASESVGQVTACAPYDLLKIRELECDPSSEVTFSSFVREQLCQEAWELTLRCLPSLSEQLRWCDQEPPRYHLFYPLVGDVQIIDGPSIGASLIIAYTAWITGLPPLRSVAVSVALCEGAFTSVNGLTYKVKALQGLPALQELIVHPDDQAEATEALAQAGLNLRLTTISTPQALIQHLWGDKEQREARALERLEHALCSPKRLKEHLKALIRAEQSGVTHALYRPLLRHLQLFERHSQYREALKELNERELIALFHCKKDLERHLNEPGFSLKDEELSQNTHEMLSSERAGLKSGLKSYEQEWLAKSLQSLQDRPLCVNTSWQGWRHALMKMSNPALSGEPYVLFHEIKQLLQKTRDNTPGRAQLMGAYSRALVHQGQLYEGYQHAQDALTIWRDLDDPDHDHELSYPLCSAWRALRWQGSARELSESFELFGERLRVDMEMKGGWAFITHELSRASLWCVVHDQELSGQAREALLTWLRPLSELLLSVCEAELSLKPCSHASSHLALLDERTPRVARTAINGLLTSQESSHNRSYLMGSLCGALYEASEVLHQEALHQASFKERCERVWGALLQDSNTNFHAIYEAQRALAVSDPQALKSCRWRELQGVAFIIKAWLEAGYKPERVAAFFEDPAHDAELLDALKRQAMYLA